jgi:GTP cyclohydrolase FolE2
LARKDSRAVDSVEFIDISADVQSEPAKFPVDAGISNLRVLYTEGNVSMPVELSIQTSTGSGRGVHMSRLVKAAKAKKAGGIEEWLRWIAGQVNETQPGSSVTCRYELPYEDRFVRVIVRTKERGALTYKFVVDGLTACPCSKKMIGVGHMQRAEITLIMKSRKALDAREVISRVSECFSATPTEELKRLDEAKKILDAQANPRFAEDLVRECVSRFPGAMFVGSRCFESIHVHDAVATWSSRPGWEPTL